MGDVVTSMAFFWGLMLLSYFLMQNGMWILNDVVKSMCRFALGKALGPAIDFVEGREGSASKTWMMQGMSCLLGATTRLLIHCSTQLVLPPCMVESGC